MKAKTRRDCGLPSGCRRIALLVAVMGTILCTLSTVPVRAQQFEPEGDDQRGMILYNEGKYQEAIDYFTKMLQGRRAFTDVNFARGNCYEALKNWQAAIADYNIVLKKKPKLYDAYVERGRSYAGLGDLSAAKQDLTTAITLKPERSDAYQVLGDTLFTGKDYEDAIANYTKFIALEPKPEPIVFQNRGEANFAAKHYAAAIADFDRFVALAPKGAGEVALKKGDSYMALKQFPEAIRAYTDYITAYPDDKDGTALNNRALAELEGLQFEAARADFKAYLKINPKDKTAYNDLIATYPVSGPPTLADLEDALRQDPTNFPVRIMYAKALSEKKQYLEAIAQYDLILTAKPDDYEDLFNRGLAETNSGDHTKALADFIAYTKAKPTDALGWQNLGIEYGLQANWKDAVAAFSQYIALKPDDVEAYKNRGIAEYNLRDSQATVADLTKYNTAKPGDAQIEKLLATAKGGIIYLPNRISPNDSASWSALGDAYVSVKKYEPATDVYTKAIAIKKDETLLYRRGLAYYNLGATNPAAYARAVADATAALSIKPGYAEAQLLKADAECAENKYKDARSDYTAFLALPTISAEKTSYAQDKLLRSALVNEDYPGVIITTTELIAADPSNLSNYEVRGVSYGELKNYTLAIPDLTRYVTMQPDDAEGWYHLGVAYFGKKDYARASSSFERALAIQPTYFDAANHAGLAYKAAADADASNAAKCGPEYDKAPTLRATSEETADALYNEATTLEAKAKNTKTKEALKAAVTVWTRYVTAAPNDPDIDKVKAHVDALKKQIADK